MLQNLLSFDEAYTRRMRVAEKPGMLRNLAILFAHSGDSWIKSRSSSGIAAGDRVSPGVFGTQIRPSFRRDSLMSVSFDW
jgi:hypothetical protein